MTTLYRPVLIESAEQAEALPDGTVVFIERPWADTTRREVGTKDHGEWWGSDCDVNFLGAEGLVSWTALVPIGAEEETHSIQTRGQTTPEWRTRLVTPWEEA